MFEWNAEQYSTFQKERTYPAIDLSNAIATEGPKMILDIGCGTGSSTITLKKRFPNAHIIGVDSSDDMLLSAQKNYPELEFMKLDVSRQLDVFKDKFDIVFSNACLQWIPDHMALLPKLFELLSDNGTLAIQIPQQTKHPMQKIIKEVAESEKWKNKISEMRSFNILTEEEYYDALSALTSDLRMWETVYFHSMPSYQSIVEWYKGSGLRFYLDQLNGDDAAEFENDLLAEIKKAYPVQADGNIIFRFPRLFLLANKRASEREGQCH